MKNDSLIPPLSVQTLAEFLRDLAYSETLFLSADWHLSVSPPSGDGKDTLYKGAICTHSRSKENTTHIYLSFAYAEATGIHDVKASVEGNIVRQENSMNFEAFRNYAMTLFGADKLYASKYTRERCMKRPVKNAPSLRELADFMHSCSAASGGTADWSLRVLHPRDNWDDVAYNGGLWTHQPLCTPPSDKYHSISFSYSRTWGVYNVMAWSGKAKITDEKKMDFDRLKTLAQSLFSATTGFKETTT